MLTWNAVEKQEAWARSSMGAYGAGWPGGGGRHSSSVRHLDAGKWGRVGQLKQPLSGLVVRLRVCTLLVSRLVPKVRMQQWKLRVVARRKGLHMSHRAPLRP